VAAAPLSVSLTQVGDGLVEFEVMNAGSDAARFPTWFTPFDEMMPLANLNLYPADQATYMGLVAKRDPTTEPVLVIEAGSSIKKTFRPQTQWEVESGLAYTLTWPGKEGLDATPARTVFKVSAAENAKFVHWDSNETLLGYTITNCGATGGQVYQNVQYAVSQATSANDKAYNCLSANSCGNNYVTWYGAQTQSRLNSITGKHQKIATALKGSWIAYCDGSECSSNVYAYVYPNDARRNIYYCSLFYRNTDLKELINTPVHEMSHFTAVAGTRDTRYGEANCKALARSSPDQAISNADNLGYFTYYVR